MIVSILLKFPGESRPTSFTMSERWGALPVAGDIIRFDQFWLFRVTPAPREFRISTPAWKDGLNLDDHVVEIEAEIVPDLCRAEDLGGIKRHYCWTAAEFEPLWMDYNRHRRRHDAATLAV